MGSANGYLSEWSSGITLWLIDSSVKIAIVSLMLLVLCRLLRRASSRLRYGVCVLALAGMVCVPITSLFVPSVSLDVDWVAASQENVVAVEQVEDQAGESELAVGLEAEEDSASEASIAASTQPPTTPGTTTGSLTFHLEWLLITWFAGTLVIGGYFLLGLLRAQWFACRDCQPVDRRWHEALSKIKEDLHLRFVPRLVCSRRTASPLTWGVVRPIVLLPVQALLWTEDRIRLTLIHESLHIKRGDWAVQLTGCFVCAIQWFNPLVWIAYRRLSIEREQSCDEQVVAQGILPSQYASHLLETARQLAARQWLPHMTLAMAHHCRLEDRILALRRHANTARRGVVLAGTSLVAMSSLLVVLVGVRLTDKTETPFLPSPQLVSSPAEPDYYSTDDRATRQEYERKEQEPIPKNIRFMMATVTMDVGQHNAFSESIQPRSNGNLSLSWTRGDSIVTFVSQGQVKFNDSQTAIAALSPGGSVKIIQSGDDVNRMLLITLGDDRKLNYEYEIQDEQQEFDTPARAWMSGLLRDAALRAELLTQ